MTFVLGFLSGVFALAIYAIAASALHQRKQRRAAEEWARGIVASLKRSGVLVTQPKDEKTGVN